MTTIDRSTHHVHATSVEILVCQGQYCPGHTCEGVQRIIEADYEQYAEMMAEAS